MLLRALTALLVLLILPLHAQASVRALEVSLKQLTKTPKKFNGKRVSVVGFYDFDGHSNMLHELGDSWKTTNEVISIDFATANIPERVVKRSFHQYVRIVGIFRYKSLKWQKVERSRDPKIKKVIMPLGFGYLGVHDKQITNITVFEPISPPQ